VKVDGQLQTTAPHMWALGDVAARDGGPVLGVHMVGPHVTDLVSGMMLAVAWEAVPAEVAALIHPHPTLSEGIGEAFLALAGKPLHGA
jgi:dihydrolipoamide dehydrogenase